MNIRLLVALKFILRQAKKGDMKYPYAGICAHLAFWDIDTLEFSSIAADWPKYSGHGLAPIPVHHASKEKDAYVVFKQHKDAGTLWKGRQLKLRIELLEFCITYLETLRQSQYKNIITALPLFPINPKQKELLYTILKQYCECKEDYHTICMYIDLYTTQENEDAARVLRQKIAYSIQPYAQIINYMWPRANFQKEPMKLRMLWILELIKFSEEVQDAGEKFVAVLPQSLKEMQDEEHC
jgi:hypothetical protein